MKKIIVLTALLFTSLSVQSEEAVYKLVDIMGGQEQVAQMHQQFVEMVGASNPQMTPYIPVIREWAEKYLSWEEMREPMADIYRKYFENDEIEQLLTFYRTPVGEKSVDLMPVLFQEGGQLGMQIAQQHQGELEAMIDAAREELEAAESAAGE